MYTISTAAPIEPPEETELHPPAELSRPAMEPWPLPLADSPRIALPVERLTPWDQPLHSADLLGPFDVWVGIVEGVHYGGAAGAIGYVQEIEVKRCATHYQTNNEPQPYEIAQAHSQPTTALVAALPWPARHDQQQYHVAKGDPVSVISGRDGRHYFFNDELPFVGVVINMMAAPTTLDDPPGEPEDGESHIVGTGTGDWEGHDGQFATWNEDESQWEYSSLGNAEDNAGGAGLLSLKVRRQSISGNPASAAATLADLLTAQGAMVEYSNVLVVGPATQHHGFRVGDRAWIKRRGSYYFTVPTRETFVGYLTNCGPDQEDDFDGSGSYTQSNYYWCRELYGDIVYPIPGDSSENTWDAVRYEQPRGTANDPTLSGGEYGRWIQAVNLAEEPTSHALTVVAPADPPPDTDEATLVRVTMHADPSDGEVWYSFERQIRLSGFSAWSGFSGTPYSGFSGWSSWSSWSAWSAWSGWSGWSGTPYSGWSGTPYSGFSGWSGTPYSGFSGWSSWSAWSAWSSWSGFSGTPYSGFSGWSSWSSWSAWSAWSGWSGWSGVANSGYSAFSGFSGTAAPILTCCAWVDVQANSAAWTYVDNSNDWRGRSMLVSLRGIVNTPTGTRNLTSWVGALSEKPHHIVGYAYDDSDGAGDVEIDSVALGAGAELHLWLEEDTGYLKVWADNYVARAQFSLRIWGTARLTTPTHTIS